MNGWMDESQDTGGTVRWGQEMLTGAGRGMGLRDFPGGDQHCVSSSLGARAAVAALSPA